MSKPETKHLNTNDKLGQEPQTIMFLFGCLAASTLVARQWLILAFTVVKDTTSSEV